MVNLNKMYDGVVNSPATYLTQNLATNATIIYVADSFIFGSLPNLAVIGTDQNAETILIKSKRSDGGLEVQRALEGPAKRWEKTTAIARNFTNFDYQQIKDNIEKLNTGKQDSLTAGSNIKITNGRISATDTKYNDTQIKKDIAELQNSQLSKASQTEAESGVDNTKYMTPQATKQAIEKLSPKQDLSNYVTKGDILDKQYLYDILMGESLVTRKTGEWPVIHGKPTSIGDNAFYKSQLTSVVIPPSVTSIGKNAFSYTKLTSVVIPPSVTSIGEGVFYKNQLTSVVIPPSVTSIGIFAFQENQLKEVKISQSCQVESNSFDKDVKIVRY